MIGFAITMLVFAGSIVALAGAFGREMRADARKRDEVMDLFIDTRDRSSPTP
jgi:hypothetical protein